MASQCYFYRYNNSWDSTGDIHVFTSRVQGHQKRQPWTRAVNTGVQFNTRVHGSCLRPVNTTREHGQCVSSLTVCLLNSVLFYSAGGAVTDGGLGGFVMALEHIQDRIKALRGPRPIPNSSGGYIYTGWEKLAIFDGNRRLSLKRCEIGQVTIQNIFHSFRETDYSYAYTFL